MTSSDAHAGEDDDAGDVATGGSSDVGCCSVGWEGPREVAGIVVPVDSSIKDSDANDHGWSCVKFKDRQDSINKQFGKKTIGNKLITDIVQNVHTHNHT